MRSTNLSYADLTLSVYLAGFAEGRRVLWVGSPAGRPEPLEGGAARVEVREGGLGELPAGAYDLAVVPDVGTLGEPPDEGVAELARIVGPEGILVLGWPVDDPESTRRRALDLLEPRCGSVLLVGQARFEGYALARMGTHDGEVLVDGTLVGSEGEPPQRLLSLCAPEAADLDPYAVIQHPRAVAGAPSAAVGAEGASGEGAVEGEYARLEAALAERSQRLRELEKEVERRGVLVRDLTEQVRRGIGAVPEPELGPEPAADSAGTLVAERDAAMERAVEAEAARAEAMFRIDELEARLGELDAQARSLREADLEGATRGLRSRVAELEEMHAQAEGRLELARMDLEAALEREQRLERDLAEMGEQFELELVRSRGAEFALRDREDREAGRDRELRERAESLAGECEGLRARLRDRESALEALRGQVAADAGNGQASKESEEAAQKRDELLERLQMEVADEERRSREREAQLDQLKQENEQLRGALVEASTAVDEREALASRVEGLEQAVARDREVLRAVREVLAGVRMSGGEATSKHEITATGAESPEAAEEQAGDAQTAELKRQLHTMQERAARLQEELEHERQARRAEAERPSAGDEGEAERLHALVGDRDAEIEALQGKLASRERETKAMQEACSEARQQIEDLLGAATESGDPATAERLGNLLRLLGRF